MADLVLPVVLIVADVGYQIPDEQVKKGAFEILHGVDAAEALNHVAAGNGLVLILLCHARENIADTPLGLTHYLRR